MVVYILFTLPNVKKN
jgi:hypothetical protein